MAWRIFAVNAVVFTLGAALLALSPATVSSPILVAEAAILVVGLVTILLVNLALVRRSLAPLRRLAHLMHHLDLLRPGARIERAGPAEVRELVEVYNAMLDRLETERKQSARDTLFAQENERKRIAHELHDEIGQALTAVMLELGRIAQRAPDDLRVELREAQEIARGNLDHVRRIAQRLRPEALDDLGLVPALTALTTGWSEWTGVRVSRRLGNDLPELSPEAELVIFRVAQESLTNVARHADATRVWVELERLGDRVLLRVRDDGRGLNGTVRGGGIRGMRERALLVGGSIAVESGERGAEVRLELPVEPRP